MDKNSKISKKDYVVIKQLPDAGVGTVVKWQDKAQHYVYKKSIPTWDEQLQTKVVHNVLTKEQVQENKEFFAPVEERYILGIDPYPDPSRSKKSTNISNSELKEQVKSAKKEVEYHKDRASFFELATKKHSKNETHYRESLHEAHALIGRLIHYIEGRVDKVNISEYFEKPNW
jgi:hypothetical protein